VDLELIQRFLISEMRMKCSQGPRPHRVFWPSCNNVCLSILRSQEWNQECATLCGSEKEVWVYKRRIRIVRSVQPFLLQLH
jgi:hypothetical protein